IPGASEITDLFEFIRVSKVEITIIPGQNQMSYTSTGATETRNIPWLYEGADLNGGVNPSLTDMRELSSTRTHLFDKVIRRTIYPKIRNGGGITDLSSATKNQYVSGTSFSYPWYGYK
ncbi:unnamed protein product, partial [Ectocarpus fasciculatus]